MGAKLSCLSKQRETAGEIPAQKKPKILSKKVRVTEVTTTQSKPVENANATPETIQPEVNHLQNEAPPKPVAVRPQIVILSPAPSDYKTPDVLPVLKSAPESIQPPLKPENYVSPVNIGKPAAEVDQNLKNVDPVAREIARAKPKPANWSDLHWALIGQRGLKTDELKVQALFSWLCSIPANQTPFLTQEELEQASKDNVEFAKEALASKSKKLAADAPENVLNDMGNNKATYLEAFESLCRYSGIPCVTIKGLVKSVDYSVGMRLEDYAKTGEQHPMILRLHHAWNACYLEGRWRLFDCIWAAQRLALSANSRLSQITQTGKMDYETDMFYFDADPTKFVYTHYPFEEQWQLLRPPMSIKQFQDSVFLKPAFFRHGLGLLSHQEGVIFVQNKLVLKLAIPSAIVKNILFTFNLRLEGQENTLDSSNLSRFGIHEISEQDSTVTFNFRFPKQGVYKLVLYARRVGEQLFSDICEYRVESKELKPADPDDSGQTSIIAIPPFPPTSQSHYGPTEKAAELGVTTVPSNLEAHLKCRHGVMDIRFTTQDTNASLPRLTARLHSLIHDDSKLNDCILVRSIEAQMPSTMSSVGSRVPNCNTGGPYVNMVVITTYLPGAGEYALEVFGAPADADENTSYFLIWQFLIDSDSGVELSTPVRKRFAKMTLGPQDDSWFALGLRTVSHTDPLVHVPTTGTLELKKARSKSELIQHYIAQGDKQEQEANGENLEVPKEAEAVEQPPERRGCDLHIVLERSADRKICMVGQLVDASTPDEEEDCTAFLVQQIDEAEEPGLTERINYLVRIPKGDHFYKLHLYAAPIERDPIPQSLPLVYTYLIEAPARLMSAEQPYIGVRWGAFPEKLEQKAAAAAKKMNA